MHRARAVHGLVRRQIENAVDQRGDRLVRQLEPHGQVGEVVTAVVLNGRKQRLDVAGLGVSKRQLEAEADLFASYLLKPLDDFRLQVGRQLAMR